jgi:hypothetical protein
MYISHQAPQAVHRDVVEDVWRRSEQRLLLRARKEGDSNGNAGWTALRRGLGILTASAPHRV